MQQCTDAHEALGKPKGWFRSRASNIALRGRVEEHSVDGKNFSESSRLGQPS